MAVKIAPNPRQQFEDANGNPYVGAKLFTYIAGSTTKLPTYTDSTGNAANTNPIILDSAGRTPFGLWLTEGRTYKLVLAPSTDTDPPSSPIFTEDVVSGVNDSATTTSQWAASGSVPTYISALVFTVPGDKTADFHVGRRLRFTVTAGIVYGLISVSTFAALTTITMIMDSTTLDSGLSAVDLSIITRTTSALPVTAYIHTLLDDVDGSTAQTTLGIGTRDITMGASAALEEGMTTLASAATPDIWTATCNLIDYTGTATATGFTAAPQRGVRRTLVCAGAAVFTAGANMLIDGVASSASLTTVAGDRVIVIALTATQFRLQHIKADGSSITLAIEQATISGTFVDFLGIPSGTKRITVMFRSVSTNGVSPFIIQIGDSGGVSASGYLSTAQEGANVSGSTIGFQVVFASVAASFYNGTVILNLQNSATFSWVSSGNVGVVSASVHVSQGGRSLSAMLDRVRITMANGTDLFDAGTINISYER